MPWMTWAFYNTKDAHSGLGDSKVTLLTLSLSHRSSQAPQASCGGSFLVNWNDLTSDTILGHPPLDLVFHFFYGFNFSTLVTQSTSFVVLVVLVHQWQNFILKCLGKLSFFCIIFELFYLCYYLLVKFDNIDILKGKKQLINV